MKKKTAKFLSAFLMSVLFLSEAVNVYGAEGFADEYYRFNDMAGVLTEEEDETLTQRLDEISERQNMDVTVVVSENLDGYDTAADYAEELYEYCKFGYGEEKDGVLLLVSMEEHDWYIATHGYGITAFTDAGIEYIGEQMMPDLAEGDYEAAFETYASLCDDFITQARKGFPFDSDSLPKEPLSPVWIPASIGIGVVLAFLVVGNMKGKLKTVAFKAAAGDYVKENSLKMNVDRDLFLYHTVTRSEKPKNDSKNKSSGSSTYKSSSGSAYGGGGGKF